MRGVGWKLGEFLSFPGGSGFFLSPKTSLWPLECFSVGYFRDLGSQMEVSGPVCHKALESQENLPH